jgi:phosphoserine phosphatase
MPMLSDAPPPYGTVVFDCDSTLSAIEGIEELASDCREEVERLTSSAMDGATPLEEVYGARLELIQPTHHSVGEVARLYEQNAMTNASELIAALHTLDKRVVVVSGGLLPAVQPFAARLGIRNLEDVHAVDIRFSESGAYAGFERESPLARGGGKIEVLRAIAGTESAGSVAFIGDGATDLEAASEVARFIAYGGVVQRANVFSAARVACTAPDFAALVPLLLSEHERQTLSLRGEHTTLLEAASSYAS